MIRGRPIRFLATVVGGWVTMRVVLLMPTPSNILLPSPVLIARAPVEIPASFNWMFPGRPSSPVRSGRIDMGKTLSASLAPLDLFRGQPVGTAPVARMRDRPDGTMSAGRGNGAGWSSAVADVMLAAQLAFATTPRQPLALTGFSPGIGLSPGESGAPATVDRPAVGSSQRWSGAAWLVWRRDGDPGRARLGGSQAGVRLDYGLAPSSPLHPTLYGRLSTALHGVAAAEGAAGIAIRPDLSFPVVVAVERRQAVSTGGRSDFAVLAASGLNPVEVGEGFRLDGYGQAGMVGVERRDAFVDGRLTLERPVGGSLDARSGLIRDFAVGAAVWGGAQPGISRLDIGPQASVRVRVGGSTLRLGAEWRAQVAGNAAPSSGPAFSLGADF